MRNRAAALELHEQVIEDWMEHDLLERIESINEAYIKVTHPGGLEVAQNALLEMCAEEITDLRKKVETLKVLRHMAARVIRG